MYIYDTNLVLHVHDADEARQDVRDRASGLGFCGKPTKIIFPYKEALKRS